MEKKGINDLIKTDNISSEESKKKMEEIDAIINNTEIVEAPKTKLPFLVIGLLVVVVILLIVVTIMDNKVKKSPKNNIEIIEIR